MTKPITACKFSKLDSTRRNELWSLLAMLCTPEIGVRRASRLIKTFGSTHEAAMAGLRHQDNWGRLNIIPQKSIIHFHNEKWRSDAKQIWDSLSALDPGVLLFADPAYPRHLKDIVDPPLVLYALGDTSLLGNAAVGIVGARDCTSEGREVTALIAHGLSEAGITVVSGLARGIDRHAHIGALKGPASTIAVLGSGIDVPYPRENASLMEEIVEKGLVVTEYAPGSQPTAANFPRRNRIISGLSLGILVVEAAQKSGSLITVRHALEQGKDVFAVPGQARSIFSKGCHELIRQGARPVFNAEDVITELAPQLALFLASSSPEHPRQFQQAPLKGAPTDNHPSLADPCGKIRMTTPAPLKKSGGKINLQPLEESERCVCQCLERNSMTLDELADCLDIEISGLMTTLTQLEVRGLVIFTETGEYLLKGLKD